MNYRLYRLQNLGIGSIMISALKNFFFYLDNYNQTIYRFIASAFVFGFRCITLIAFPLMIYGIIYIKIKINDKSIAIQITVIIFFIFIILMEYIIVFLSLA